MSRARTLRVALGAGLALAGGVLVDRRVGLRRRDRAAEHDAHPLGGLRGEPHEVKADDGVMLHAEVDDGPAGGATVVFVHGFALTQDCWHFQRAAFRGERRMVFFDLRSHGRSGRSSRENATIDQLGKDLREVIDTVAPGEPVVLVGHSMGGMAIVALAEQHPELFDGRVVGVGLISTTAGGQRTHKILSRHIPDAVGRRVVEKGLLLAAQRERLLELARSSGSAVAMKLVEEFAFGPDVPDDYVTFLDSMIAQTPMGVLVEFFPQFDALDKFHVVEAFSAVPTWIMGGTKDRLTSIGHARKLNSRILGSRLVEFEGAGHLPLFDYADRVNENLRLLFAAADRLAEDRGFAG